MALIVKYKFQNVDADGNSITLLPQFPSGVNYTKTDVVEGNITTRVIETDDLSKVTYIRFGCDEATYVAGAWEYLTEILDINISYVNTFNRMFRGCKLLNKINVSNWDTKSVTSMENMFYGCKQLTQLDVSNWDTSSVGSMAGMFHTCIQLTQLDVSKWVTSKVANMGYMFYSCSQLTRLDLSNWDTSSVANMNTMFGVCSQLTQLDLSNWDTSNVISMYNMFANCSQLTQLDVSNFDTSKATNMQNMFNGCKVENVGLIYCSKDTIDKLANCITSPCNFYVTNKTYTSPNSLVKYVMYREDKKRIVYYNDETQTWEKPVLRQWDSIEKHSDGKYYYHKRSGEVVLNGGEAWNKASDFADTIRFYNNPTLKHKSQGLCISDKFNVLANGNISNTEGIVIGVSYGINIEISKSKLSTQDVAGFKTWLKANPTTVVYQLAEEKVYECTDLDLITYANETNLLVKSGVLNPKVTLKVHQNITNIITILQEKVSVLENVFIQGLKQVLAGDMQSLAYMLYPEDFENIEQSIDETSLGEQQDDPTDE